METQRDKGYYGAIDVVDKHNKKYTYSFYKDSRRSLYKTQKPLLARLKKQVEYYGTIQFDVRQVRIVEAKVVEVQLSSTVVTPDDLK